MEISDDVGLGKLRVESLVIDVPHQIDNFVEIENLVVVQLATDVDYENENADFELADPGRNIVAFDSTGDLLWTISDTPQPSNSDERSYYDYLFTLTGKLFARDVENRLYEIDPVTGRIERTFDSTTLPLAGKEIPLDGWIVKVLEFDDYVVIGVGEPQYHTLYGFDTDGTELWRAGERRGTAYWDGEVLIEKVSRGPRSKSFYRLDPDTGERLAEIEVENTDSGWQYVADVSDGV